MLARLLLIISAATLVWAPPAIALKTEEPKAKRAPEAGPRVWVVRATQVSMTVDFHGDPAGCEEHGVCDKAGSLQLTTPAGAGIMIGLGGGSREAYFGGLLEQGKLVASVTTSGAAAPCADTVRGVTPLALGVQTTGPATFVLGTLSGAAKAVAEGLGGAVGQPFSSRCGGPVISDLVAGLPTARIPAFRRQRSFKIVLDQTQQFSGGAFAGTVTTTGTLRFRRGSLG